MPEPTWLSSSIASRMNTGRLRGSSVRACSSIDGKSKAYRELGLFSLKKKIEDAVLRAELMATSALELEEARRIKQEEMIRNYDLWDDPTKSNDILVKLADTARAVDALKDLAYKAEEAKLITQLAEMDAINYGLVEQAYSASLDVAKSLDQYEMLKLLKGPYDAEGASLEIKAGPGGMHNEHWAQELLNMYLKWAEKQGCRGRIIRKGGSKNGGISSATLEFEFGYAYGYLRGERGVHCMLRCSEKEVNTAAVDLIPLFLGTSLDLHIDEEDLIVLCPSSPKEELCGQSRVIIQHAPTGIIVESSGERSRFGNKMKALNRLKARLLVIASEQRVSNVTNIRREDIIDVWTSQWEGREHYIPRSEIQARKALRALKGVARLQAVARGHVPRRRILPKARRKPPSNGNKELSRAKREPEAVTRETKDEFNSPRNWDRSSYLKPEIEASWLRNEAVDKWGRMKKYSYSFQEGRRNPQMTEEWMMMPIKDRGRRSCRLKQPPPPAEPTSSNGDNKPERATGRKTVFSDHTAGEIHPGEALNIITPRSLPRRSFCQVKRLSVAIDDSNLPCSLVFPTYMAITESARAKSRSMSTPRQRIGHLDACN
ncbi:hypothetical protein SAY86_025160 [Trapa natans]|uniref:Peptide chain release factor domain-containing protein n=1 Tax=Trapa natans TaxID=22666 RepID=A0AAN7MQK2_TRANT|nr:hypothetical protein SAY86_025160 [Trapa natans]